jgi:hypothetical protein
MTEHKRTDKKRQKYELKFLSWTKVTELAKENKYRNLVKLKLDNAAEEITRYRTRWKTHYV